MMCGKLSCQFVTVASMLLCLVSTALYAEANAQPRSVSVPPSIKNDPLLTKWYKRYITRHAPIPLKALKLGSPVDFKCKSINLSREQGARSVALIRLQNDDAGLPFTAIAARISPDGREFYQTVKADEVEEGDFAGSFRGWTDRPHSSVIEARKIEDGFLHRFMNPGRLGYVAPVKSINVGYSDTACISRMRLSSEAQDDSATDTHKLGFFVELGFRVSIFGLFVPDENAPQHSATPATFDPDFTFRIINGVGNDYPGYSAPIRLSDIANWYFKSTPLAAHGIVSPCFRDFENDDPLTRFRTTAIAWCTNFSENMDD